MRDSLSRKFTGSTQGSGLRNFLTQPQTRSVKRDRSLQTPQQAGQKLRVLSVVVLWAAFIVDYAVTRDIYFTLAIIHVLAEIPFLIRRL